MSSNNIYGAFPTTTNGPFHYLYRITNLVENKHYYGARTSKTILPQDDLGKKYFSSSSDKDFKKSQKEHPENYKYKVIIVSDSRQHIADLEVKLHHKLNVSENNNFYNLANQTSTFFDSSGKINGIDSAGNIIRTTVDDLRFLTGDLVYSTTGKISVKNEFGKIILVPKDHPKVLSGEYVFMWKNTKWISNIELQQEKNINKDDPIPTGWVLGKKLSASTPKGSRRIFNQELNKSSILKPGEELLTGWEFDQINKLGEKYSPPSVKGCKCIFNLETKKNSWLKPGEELPSGWEYGRNNTKPIKGRRWIYNTESKKNSWLTPGDEIPIGWELGNIKTKKSIKRIYNTELKQNRAIESGEILPEGWQYGQKNFSGKSSIEKGSKRIYNIELKENRVLKPDEDLPEGWNYGSRLFGGKKSERSKGCKWIFNQELKQTKFLKPGEILMEGWEFGRRKTWD